MAVVGSLDRTTQSISAWVLKAAVSTAVLLTLPTPTLAQDFSAAQEHILEVMAERRLPSVSVAVARGGEVLWEEAFGWADRERRVEATPHTMYSLASISKPVTATAVMMLAQRGEVELDAPVNRYLGLGKVRGLAADASGATVRRVLSHTSGLPLHYQFFYEDEETRPPTPDETIARYGIVTYPPGRQFQYSNIGYGVLDHLVTRVSGTPYADFLRRELFVPLGLTHTSVDVGPGLDPFAAVRYGEDHRPVPWYVTDHPGASQVYASAHDLVRLGMFHLGRHGPDDLLGPDARHAMRVRATPDGESDAYGLGWFLADEYGHAKAWHTGSMPGVSTMLALYPDDEVVVVVLMNALARDLRYSINEELAAAAIPGYREARQAERAGDGDGSPPSPSSAPVAELRGTWSGTLRTWLDEHDVTMTVQDDGDVHVGIQGQLSTLLNSPSLSGGRLTGEMAATIPTPDARRGPPHFVAVNLRVEGDRMFGQASARTYSGLTHFNLTSYVELRRVR